jgi:hypothetical protein
MIGIKINVNKSDLDRISKKLNSIPGNLSDANFKLAEISAKEIKFQLIAQTKKAPRTGMAQGIYAKKQSKKVSAIFMPIRSIWLDSMRPHYVSVKRGRNIYDWVNKYYDGNKKTRFIFVRPDPFVSKALNRIRARYGTVLKGAVDKTFRKTRTN